MTSPSPNRGALAAVAHALGRLRDQLVLVGGQAAELLITDPAAVRVRPTDDVDTIVSATTRVAYYRIAEQLRARNFREDMREGAPLCRWRHGEDLTLDVMPLAEDVLGFTNQWYGHAFTTARTIQLEPGLAILMVTAPAFLATKWAAFDSRGHADHIGSHDVEDIVTVIAGRPELVDELNAEPQHVRSWLASRTAQFLAHPDSADAIEGALPDARQDPRILQIVRQRFESIAALRS